MENHFNLMYLGLFKFGIGHQNLKGTGIKMNVGWIGFLKKDESYWEKLQKLYDLGYKGFEGGDEIYEAGEEEITRLKNIGLKILTIGVDLNELMVGHYDQYIKKAHALDAGQATIFCCSVNGSFFGKVPVYDEVMREYEAMEQAAIALKKEGIDLCYHNHYQDFLVYFNCMKAFDLLIANTQQLKMELDVGWVKNGLEDPCQMIKRISTRLASVHIKDYLNGEPRIGEDGYKPIHTTVGNGILDVDAIVTSAQDAGVEWLVVEQDELHNLNEMDSLTASYLNLKETGKIF